MRVSDSAMRIAPVIRPPVYERLYQGGRGPVFPVLSLEGQRPYPGQFGRILQRVARVAEITPGREGRNPLGTRRTLQFGTGFDAFGGGPQIVVTIERHPAIAHQQRIFVRPGGGRAYGNKQANEHYKRESLHRHRIFTW